METIERNIRPVGNQYIDSEVEDIIGGIILDLNLQMDIKQDGSIKFPEKQ